MKKSQIVLRLFIPSDQQTAKAVHPGMCSLHHPTTSLETGLTLDGLGFFSTLADVGSKAECVKDVTHLLIVVALVQTSSLWPLFSWLWAINDDALNGWAYKFHISAIGSLNCHADRHSMTLCEQTPLDSTLATIGRIGSGFFPT